jgi:hypothetical protein
MWMFTRNLVGLLALAGVLSGCGSGPNSAPAGSATHPAVPKTLKPADPQSRNMVSAVPATKGGSLPVQVKFRLRERPDVAQPLEVDLAIVPVSAVLERVAGKVEVEDGLELVEGGEIPATDRPAEGVTIQHTVKVLPKRDGIFTMTAVLTLDSLGRSSNETFSIPVIAGSGMPDLPAKPGAATARGSAPRPQPAATQ